MLKRPLLWIADRLQKTAGPDGAMAFGNSCIRDKKYAQAEEAFASAERAYLEKHSGTDPLVVAAMAKRAWCLVTLGKVDEGLDLYRRALLAKESNGDVKEPTAQKLRDYISNAERQRN